MAAQQTNKLKIAVIAGDGIGNEVVPEGIKVLEAVSSRFGLDYAWDTLDWSCERFAKTGAMMPADGLEQIAKHDAIYLGAVGWPGVPDHVSLWGLLIPIRRGFQQYVNLRPVRLRHRLRDLFPERSAVPDTGRAAVPDQIESKALEVLEKATRFEVPGHDPRARGEARFHPGPDVQAAGRGFSGEESGSHHRRGVRGVGAARDRRQDHGAVSDLGTHAVDLDRNPRLQASRSRSGGARPRLRGRDDGAPLPYPSGYRGGVGPAALQVGTAGRGPDEDRAWPPPAARDPEAAVAPPGRSRPAEVEVDGLEE